MGNNGVRVGRWQPMGLHVISSPSIAVHRLVELTVRGAESQVPKAESFPGGCVFVKLVLPMGTAAERFVLTVTTAAQIEVLP